MYVLGRFFDKITFETNLYGAQKLGGATNYLPITKDKIKVFIGLNMPMGIKKLPSMSTI